MTETETETEFKFEKTRIHWLNHCNFRFGAITIGRTETPYVFLNSFLAEDVIIMHNKQQFTITIYHVFITI